MDKFLVFSILVVCFCKHETNSLNLPGPLVYVVTPSPRPPQDQGRAAPFYYHNWMRRMDSPPNATTTTTAPKTKTLDLIFAEFESGNRMKSIRKLLENEKIEPKATSTTTTRKPIFVAHKSSATSHDVNFAVPVQTNKKKEDEKPVDMTDYFALYNNQYNSNSDDFVPVYMPSTTPSTTTSTTTTTTAAPIQDVQNIWHIIDSQKYDQYSGKWEEEPVPSDDTIDLTDVKPEEEDNNTENQDLDENFALPGFATNPGNGGENESRAINKEMNNLRFPYVNLKPFQMKSQKRPNTIPGSSKATNMLNLDNFHDLKNPVRGEAQDVVSVRKPVDRYNPAQPYLPDYATKSKQSSPPAPPAQAVANLVPPPPPPPKITDDDFPAPESYESFPPYAPIRPPANPPPPPPPAPTPSIAYQLPDDSELPDAPSGSDIPPIEYHYKPPPPPPVQPTYTHPAPPPPSKPYGGYSYDKPSVVVESPPDTYEKPDYEGYSYSKPPPPQYQPPDTYGHYKPYGYHYHPAPTTTEMPRVNRFSYYYLGKKLYYLPLYFSVYFIVYVGALIIKAVLRHKIVYPNSWRPNTQTAGFFSKRSVDTWDLSNENLHEITGRVTRAIAVAGEKYFAQRKK